MKFKKIIYETVGSLNENKAVLVKALFIPFILLIALDAIEWLEPHVLILIIGDIVSFVIYAIFAIITHRIVLLGPMAVSKWGLYKWTQRETMFVFYYIILEGLFLPIYYIEDLPVAILLVLLIFSIWLATRFSLVFPATAIDHRTSLTTSWELTKNRQNLTSNSP
jgi:hypothetical protein